MAALAYDDPSATWEDKAVAVVRGLALDGPAAAKNGHSGTAMALAPLGVALFSRVLRHDPTEPGWPDRDRFVLSCGHASILLYSLLHLSGYDLPLDQLRRFRELGSITPGHPENRLTPGVEVTTGPLGQGFSNAVGMAIAERYLRHTVGESLVDHHTWVFASDGDLMEGVSHESASLAGHLGLGRLCAVYDDNHITIDGSTELALSDDAPARFRAYGWDVHQLGESANDLDALTAALLAAKEDTGRPTLLVLRSHIGYPAPTWTDNHEAHGTPFPPEELAATKQRLGLPEDEPFFVPPEVRDAFVASLEPMRDARASWNERYAADATAAAALDRLLAGAHGSPRTTPITFPADKEVATRSAASTLLTEAATRYPGLLSGAADLTGNTGALLEGRDRAVQGEPDGPPAALRDPRVRHGGLAHRHGAARRHRPGRAPRSSCSPTTCARRSAWRRSRRRRSAICSATTRSDSARTAPRTSPWTSCARCAPSRASTSSVRPTPTRPRRCSRRSSGPTVPPR